MRAGLRGKITETVKRRPLSVLQQESLLEGHWSECVGVLG